MGSAPFPAQIHRMEIVTLCERMKCSTSNVVFWAPGGELYVRENV